MFLIRRLLKGYDFAEENDDDMQWWLDSTDRNEVLYSSSISM
jgi:hypothetical protein